MTSLEARWRDALLGALIPSPGRGLPAFGDVDLAAFWPRFYASAPFHLRLGLRLATFALAVVLPIALGRFRTIARLDGDAREAVVVRAAGLPVFSSLLEVAKLVACLAYFTDAHVQAVARERR